MTANLLVVKKLLIIGAGGFGLELLQYVRDEIDQGWPYDVVGFIDDSFELGTLIDSCPVVGSTLSPPEMEAEILVGVGDPEKRLNIYNWVLKRGLNLATLIHKTAYVAPTAKVKAGSIVAPNALIAAHATVGPNALLNVYSSIGHESSIGNSSVAAPYSAVLGRTQVGSGVLLAARATILPNLKVGDFAKVSAHSLVNREVGTRCLAVGNPARSREIFKDSTPTINSV